MLIGISGFKSSGKSTIAEYLVKEHGFTELSFADKMKDAICALLLCNRDELERWKNDPVKYVVTPAGVHILFRDFLKLFGTEAGRDIYGQEHWVDLILPNPAEYGGSIELAATWHKNQRYVVSDCRFANEYQRILLLHGYVIRVERPGYTGDIHGSEQEPDVAFVNYRITNDKYFWELYNKIDDVLYRITERDRLYG